MLTFFRYLGHLSATKLAAIVKIVSLGVLQVRNSTDVLQIPSTFVPIPNMSCIDLPWTRVWWPILEAFKCLRWDVNPYEVDGSAKGAASLSLRRLHASCWGWGYGTLIQANPYVPHLTSLPWLCSRWVSVSWYSFDLKTISAYELVP